jgi:hypothetical protein
MLAILDLIVKLRIKHLPLLLVFVLFAPLLASAQQSRYADQFLGIHWGVSIEEVKEAMRHFPDTRFGEETENGNLIYYGGTYSGHDVTTYVMLFEREKFYGVSVLFEQLDGSRYTRTIFDTLRDDLIKQFGHPADTTIESDLSSSIWHLAYNQEIILRLREDERIVLDYNDWATALGESKSEEESGK